MLKLRFGRQIINLIKDVKGSQRAGHKYCKREPLGDGSGFKYWYAKPGGKCGDADNESDDLTHVQAKKRHPEHYDASRPRFNVSDKAAEVINHSSYAKSDEKRFGPKNKPLTFKQYKDKLKKLYSGDQSSAAEGVFNEYMHTFSKEIGDGKIDSIDDLIRLADTMVKRFGKQTDAYSKEITQESLMVLANISALNELPQDTVGGAARLERLWDNATQFWNETRMQFRETYGSDFNMDNVRIRMSGKNVGAGKKADLFTKVLNKETGEWESDKFAISLKINTGKPISWSEGSPITALIDIFKDSGINSLQKLSIELDTLYNSLNKKFDKKNYPNLSGDELNREIMYRFKNEFYKKFNIDAGSKRTEIQKDMLADLGRLAMKQVIDLHKDPKTANLAISMMSIDKDTGKANHIGCSARALEKVWNNFFNSGEISVEWGKTGNFFMSSTGEKIPVIGDVKFIGGPENDKQTFALIEGRHTKKSIQWRGPSILHIKMMTKASKINDGFGYLKERIEIVERKKKSGLNKSERIMVILAKSTQTTERKKMNAKYIRKELTESGKVRYIYKETNPRTKKVEEQEPVRRNKFSSTVDSVDPAYKALFEESCGEIADEHFININAGCASIRFTKDVDMFLDALSVPKELKDSEEFTGASGSFNVSKGTMAFCTTNFPDDVSEVIKKAVLMHEVGHAYFYGTLRIKAKKPLTADAVDSKDKDQKDFVKNSTKFVDTFGKMDAELRKKAEFDVADVKGQDKETLLQDAIKTYMVSDYATLSGEEHFAEAFSRYFIMPEQLKKKELEVYNHFEAFFQKYGE